MGLSVGTVMGYTEEADGWYDSTNTKVEGFMGVLAGKTVGNLPNALDEMTVGDLFGSNLTGVFKIIGTDTPISELDEVLEDKFDPNSSNAATVQDFMDAGLLTLDSTTQTSLDTLATVSGENWRTMTLNGFVNWIIGIAAKSVTQNP